MALSKNLIQPGAFKPGEHCDTDNHRCEYDIMNDTVISCNTKVDVVLMGDSITDFYDNNVHLWDCGCILNRGTGGDTVEGVNFRFEADVIQLKPQICVILVGVNNTWGLEELKGEDGYFLPDEVAKVLAHLKEQFEQIYAKAKAAGIEIWLCSATPMGEGMPSLKARNALFPQINELYKALVAEHGGKYVDYYSVLLDDDGVSMKGNYSRDGVHPNGLGYAKMAEVIRPLLKEALGK